MAGSYVARGTLLWMLKTYKAVAYVLCRGRLLVFTQPDSPEAGVQVPAGTIRSEETPQQAVLRELEEETGIEDVLDLQPVGTASYDMTAYGRDEMQERHFFQMTPAAELPERWRWYERHDGLAPPDPLELFWIPAESAAETLEAGQGELLHGALASGSRAAGA
jgi:8-oxo-dGTP pyrophosphatase MutT (NUDIX family)